MPSKVLRESPTRGWSSFYSQPCDATPSYLNRLCQMCSTRKETQRQNTGHSKRNETAASVGTFNQVVSGELLEQALVRGLIVKFLCHLGWLPLLLTRQNVFNRCLPCFLRLLLKGLISQCSLSPNLNRGRLGVLRSFSLLPLTRFGVKFLGVSCFSCQLRRFLI